MKTKGRGRPASTANGETTGFVAAVLQSSREMTAEDCAEDLGVALTTGRYHLRRLVEQGLATSERDGMSVIYRATQLLDSICRTARKLG